MDSKDIECYRINYAVEGWREVAHRKGELCVPFAAVLAINALCDEVESLRKERDDRLSDAKHYFEWLGEVQEKLDAYKQELASTKANDREYITVLEDRSNKYSDQLTRYRAVMEQAVEALGGAYLKDLHDDSLLTKVIDAKIALREVLKEK